MLNLVSESSAIVKALYSLMSEAFPHGSDSSDHILHCLCETATDANWLIAVLILIVAHGILGIGFLVIEFALESTNRFIKVRIFMNLIST